MPALTGFRTTYRQAVQEVGVALNELGSEPSLEYVAATRVLTVPPLGVWRVYLLHRMGKVRLVRCDHRMVMIRHQTEGVTNDAV